MPDPKYYEKARQGAYCTTSSQESDNTPNNTEICRESKIITPVFNKFVSQSSLLCDRTVIMTFCLAHTPQRNVSRRRTILNVLPVGWPTILIVHHRRILSSFTGCEASGGWPSARRAAGRVKPVGAAGRLTDLLRASYERDEGSSI